MARMTIGPGLLGEVTVLTRHGRPAAAIVPADRAAAVSVTATPVIERVGT